MKKTFDTSFMNTELTPFEIMMQGGDNPAQKELEIIENTEGRIVEIEVSKLKTHHKHAFSVKHNKTYKELTDSIKSTGIIVPLIVSALPDGNYELIMGHRRTSIARDLGIEKVPCKIVDVPDYKSDQWMVDTNINRNDDEISPSEKANALEIKYQALKKQIETEKSENIGSCDLVKAMALDTGMSINNIYKYRALKKLIPELMDLTDEGKMPIKVAYIFSSLSKNDQKAIYKANVSISLEHANKIKNIADGSLTTEQILEITTQKKPRTKIDEKLFTKYYPESIKHLSPEDREKFIIDCIKAYKKNNKEWNQINI